MLEPVRNIHMLKLRELQLNEIEKEMTKDPLSSPAELDVFFALIAKFRDLGEEILASYEFFRLFHPRRVILADTLGVMTADWLKYCGEKDFAPARK